MARAFSEEEKSEIKKKLIEECERCWSKYGYKKTNIGEICRNVGISKGAFYIFYESKEMLFCDVMDQLQSRLIVYWKDALTEHATKYDFATVLKRIYREYDAGNWIINFSSPDFVALKNRLPKDRLEQHKLNSKINFNKIVERSHLEFKIEEDKAVGILNALLSLLERKDNYGYDHYEIFCFVLDNIIEKIFV